MGDPHFVCQPLGGYSYTYWSCQNPGWMDLMLSTYINVAARHAVVWEWGISGRQDPASNNGLHVSSPYASEILIDNDLITIGGHLYTRPQLLNAISTSSIVADGLVVSTTSHGVLNDLTFVFTRLRFTLKVVGFWAFDSTKTFFSLMGFLPDTLPLVGGLWQLSSVNVCPTGRTTFDIHSPPVTSAIMKPEHDPNILNARFGLLAVTPTQAHQVCDPMLAISTFYFDACMYDVIEGNNPNLANVIIENLNAIVEILEERGLLANFTALVNVEEGTFNGVRFNDIFHGFPTVFTDPVSPSSTGSNAGRSESGSSGPILNSAVQCTFTYFQAIVLAMVFLLL
jgi:hypothetical protein